MADPGPGTRVGRYQLVSPIGAGGMGRVWVALDTAAPAQRLVALKTALSREEDGSSAEYWAMLSDEASIASRIDHPNVCATYELGIDEGVRYLVMEWSDGASLRDLLDAVPNRRISPELTAFIGQNVAAGLHAAHELTGDDGAPLSVVHRDVSPQNVLVSMRGDVRLADFGVAKARGQQHRPTETGEIKGKLSYMAPEQVTSKYIDRRADVFALGCVLYEASLGVRPFHGADALATMYKILEEALVPPRQLDPEFPEALETVLMRALEKDPGARYRTAEDLRAGLADYLSSTGRYFTGKHVAELFSGALGDKLRERNRAILALAGQLRQGETDPSRLGSPPPPESTKTLTPEGGIERSVSVATRKAARKQVGLFLALGLLAGLAVAVPALWPKNSPAVEPTIAAPAPVPAAEPVSTASLSIQPPSAASAAVTAISAPSSSSPSVRPPPRRGPASVAARPTASAAGSVPAPKPTGRKPRPLDHSNPFANP